MDSRDYYRSREANERLAAANSINIESRTIHADLADKYAWLADQPAAQQPDGAHIRPER